MSHFRFIYKILKHRTFDHIYLNLYKVNICYFIYNNIGFTIRALHNCVKSKHVIQKSIAATMPRNHIGCLNVCSYYINIHIIK